MNEAAIKVYLNRFPLKKLTEVDKTVQIYKCNFESSPELGQEYSAINSIPYKIGYTSGVRFGSTIITKEKISDRYLSNKDWTLQHQETKLLNPENLVEKQALERLERRWLGNEIRQISERNRVEKSSEGGFIWWNADKVILADLGWEVHTGVRLDLDLHSSGMVLVEIDTHHRFYSPWTLEQWLQTYSDLPIKWVRNTYNFLSWQLVRTTNENPEQVILSTGASLADYHRKLNIPATEAEIKDARVVYLNSKNQEIPHLSTRLRPSITMEILSILKERGSKEAAKVFSQTRQPTKDRFEKGENTAKWLAQKIYNVDVRIKPQKVPGIILRDKSPLLLTKSIKVNRPKKSLDVGCYSVGEKQFGCLDLTNSGGWSKFISNKLESVAKKSDVNIFLESAKNKQDLPNGSLARKQFWQSWANQGTQTILVVTPWLENTVKAQFQREALEANIALQFMQPMFKLEDYRIANIVLGLLLKAKWQPVGLETIQDQYAAEVVIGFDAGTNRQMYYGTSAFAVLANGQNLGWEIPEAQRGETISGQVVWRTVSNIITRFQAQENRMPKRILLLRDGIVQADEFLETVAELNKANIAVDILGVRKSGAGRMAVLPDQLEFLTDASSGTAILSADGNTFRIVTSEAKAGGSARPLQVVRDYGDAPLEILARQIDRLCMLNPASASAYSRLPYVIHFADRMAKLVQRLGGVGVLQGVDRQKIICA
ncbi:MAG: argonaute PAZ domain-containing protein [Pleurocapsa sp.]